MIIASAGPEPKKSIPNPRVPPWHILLEGKQHYVIHPDELRNLAIEGRDDLTRIFHEKDIDARNFFPSCITCDFNQFNLYDLALRNFSNGEDVTIIEDTSNLEQNSSEGNLFIAESFEKRIVGWKRIIPFLKPLRFYAISDNGDCIFYNTLINFLAENQELEPYKSNEPFNFKSIRDFEEGKANPLDYRIR